MMATAFQPRPTGPKPRVRSQGMALIVALIVLAAMTVAATALVRAVDTTIAIAGNVGLRDAAIPAADAAMEAAWAALYERSAIPDRDHDLPAESYFASRQPGEDPRGVPRILQQVDRYPDGAPVQDAGNGYTVRHAIERLCLGPGPPTPANCALVRPWGAAPVAVEEPEKGPTMVPVFRVTARVDGPRNTVTLVQAMLRDGTPPQRMSWRLLAE
jgi:type IV pilus assembly protein PilX